MSKSLSGRLVLVTRPIAESRELARLFEEKGATTLVQPGVVVSRLDDFAALDEALASASNGEFDWALFSSVNGAKFVAARLIELKKIASELDFGVFFRSRGIRVGAVGKATSRALASRGVEVAVEPRKFDALGLVAALREEIDDFAPLRFLSFRASRGRDALNRELAALGADVREVVAYRNEDATEASPETLAALRAGRVDAAVATSSASCAALARILGDAARKTRWIAISPITADALSALGIEVAGIAREASSEALVDAVAEVLSRS